MFQRPDDPVSAFTLSVYLDVSFGDTAKMGHLQIEHLLHLHLLALVLHLIGLVQLEKVTE